MFFSSYHSVFSFSSSQKTVTVLFAATVLTFFPLAEFFKPSLYYLHKVLLRLMTSSYKNCRTKLRTLSKTIIKA